MKDVTDYILSKTSKIIPEAEVTGATYSMFNTGGVEVEVAEYLYSLVRLYKPNFIVETGTHLGISSLYMALGLEKNGTGLLETYEVIQSLQAQAQALWADLNIQHRIVSHLKPSLSAHLKDSIDILFLDSEPQFRFDEFIYFWPMLRPGGIVIIHDLHPTLGKSGIEQAGMTDWPYGPWEKKLGKFVKDYDIQMLFAPSPRGLTIMQKTRETDENIKFLNGHYDV